MFGLRGRLPPGLHALISQYRPAAQADLIAFNGNYFDQQLIPFLELIANIPNTMFGHLADVKQAVSSGEDLNERTEVRQANDFTKIRLADLRFSKQILDYLDRFVCGFLLCVAVVVIAGCGSGRVVLPVTIDPNTQVAPSDSRELTNHERAVQGIAALLVRDLKLPMPDRVTVFVYASRPVFEQGLIRDANVSPVRGSLPSTLRGS